MATLNYASIGNTVLIIGGLIATYLTSIGYLKEAGLVTLIALIIKGIFSEIDNQKSGTTTPPPTPTATAAPQTNTKYTKIRAYFTRHFWLY
jgi:hypothetical protein